MSILDKICQQTAQDVVAHKNQPLPMRQDNPRGFVQAIQAKIPETTLICEIKRASPSAGLIRADFNPARHATDYEKAGAACLSVLTEPHFFQGSFDHLKQAKAACSLPILRKDFMVDQWQVEQSHAIGADCILIIMAAIPFETAKDILLKAGSLGLDCLIEVHTKQELEAALDLPLNPKNHLLGINNRNLKTLSINLQTSLDLQQLAAKSGCIVVSESGIKTATDIDQLKQADIHTFLVGESLLKQPDLTAAVQQLINKPIA